jgi:hypothetical protein
VAEVDELEPASNQEEVKFRTLKPELPDEAEDLLHIAAMVDGL